MVDPLKAGSNLSSYHQHFLGNTTPANWIFQFITFQMSLN